MSDAFEQRLAAAAAARLERRGVGRRLLDIAGRRRQAAERLAAHAAVFAIEQRESDALERGVLGRVRGIIAGDAVRAKEIAEADAARAVHDAAVLEVAALDAEIAGLEAQAAALGDADAAYAALVGERVPELIARGGPDADRLRVLATREAELDAERLEIGEAIRREEGTLASLVHVVDGIRAGERYRAGFMMLTNTWGSVGLLDGGHENVAARDANTQLGSEVAERMRALHERGHRVLDELDAIVDERARIVAPPRERF